LFQALCGRDSIIFLAPASPPLVSGALSGVGWRPLGTPKQAGEEDQGWRDRASEDRNDELREKIAHSGFLRLATLILVVLDCVILTSGVLWQGLHAYEWKPQTAYAIKDSVEVGLVYYPPRYDRLSAFYLHLHARKGPSKPIGEYALYHYFVEHPVLTTP
jgi:hypothetical protein